MKIWGSLVVFGGWAQPQPRQRQQQLENKALEELGLGGRVRPIPHIPGAVQNP